MLSFIICDDDIHMINKLSLLFEKAFMKNDFDAKIVLKTQNYKELLSFMSSNPVNVVCPFSIIIGLNVPSLSLGVLTHIVPYFVLTSLGLQYPFLIFLFFLVLECSYLEYSR